MGILLGTLAIVLIAGAAVKLIKNRKKTFRPVSETPEQPPVVSSQKTITGVMDSLLSLNLMIRTDHDLEKELMFSIEQIIDDIRLIFPAMLERYPAESLTYELEKIGSNHLKKIVKEYLDLSLPGRQAQYSIFTSTIDNLAQVTKRARQIIENNETAEFKTMAHFLAGKFSS